MRTEQTVLSNQPETIRSFGPGRKGEGHVEEATAYWSDGGRP